MKEILKDIKEQIQSFDYKASIMIGISGIIFGFSFNFTDIVSQLQETLILRIITLILVGVFYGLIFAIIFCLVKVIIPRGKRKKKQNDSYDIIYYYDIATHNDKKFYENIDTELENTRVFKRQIVECSKVAKEKYDYLKTSMILFVVLIIISIVFLMLGVIISG